MSKPHRTSPIAAARPAGRHRRRLVATAVTALVAVGIAGCGQNGAGEQPVPAGGALPPAEFPEPGVVHVHGLGVDPADGVLYAATHSGLFRLPAGAGEASRVANRYQDTMGFTVVGPNAFLGSGHPDFREDNPPRLGLIESTDAGQSWQPLSLRGEADFHSLQAAHGNVYGYESGSGAFLVSTDRKDWETRSTLAMRDFAVSPTDPETVLATTERGLVRSTDGGRSWSGVAGAPALAVLGWTQQGSLYGVGRDGAVQHSADDGTTWTPRGEVGGAPEAVTVDLREGQETLYVAVAERGILQSTDGGASFTTRYTE